MNKLAGISILLIVIVATVAIASAIHHYMGNMTVTVGPNPALTIFMEGNELPINGTIDWGALDAGYTWEWNMTVVNVGNINQTVSFIVTNIPTDWTITWTPANNTLLIPNTNVTAPLELTIPATTPNATYTLNYSLIG